MHKPSQHELAQSKENTTVRTGQQVTSCTSGAKSAPEPCPRVAVRDQLPSPPALPLEGYNNPTPLSQDKIEGYNNPTPLSQDKIVGHLA